MDSFFSALFEFGGGFASSSATELQQYVYVPVGFILIFFTMLVCASYYKIFDAPTYHRFWHWLILGGCTMGGMFLIAWIYTISAFKTQSLEAGFTEYANFLVSVCLFSLVFFTLWSFVFKLFSVNRRKTPF